MRLASPRTLAKLGLRTAAASTNPVVQTGYRLSRESWRFVANTITGKQVGWMAQLRMARWTDDGFEFGGWAYARDHGFAKTPTIQVWLESGDRRVDAEVTLQYDRDANALVKEAKFDYGNTGFVARLAMADLVALLDDTAVQRAGWTTWIRVSGPEGTYTGTFKYRNRFSSARHLSARTLADDVQVLPTWRSQLGLRFYLRQPAFMAESFEVAGSHVSVDFSTNRIQPASGCLREQPSGETPMALTHVGDNRWRLSGDVPTPPTLELVGLPVPSRRHRLVIVDASGEEHPLASRLDRQYPAASPDAALYAYASPGGSLRFRDFPQGVAVVEAVELLDAPALRITGWFSNNLSKPTLTLQGPRQAIPISLTVEPDGRFTATVALLVSDWGGPELPPMTGAYRLRGADADGTVFGVSCATAVVARTPESHDLPGFRLKLQVAGGRQLRLLIGAPRRDDELGSFHQRRLHARYLETTFTPRNAVYFESFYRRKATCNPWALDREIARRHPELTRFWGVVDSSIPVPPGAVPVVQGTREWFEAKGTARYVIINDWLRRKFKRQPFQVVLQTWHGSMLKRIGLDRPNVAASTRRAVEIEKAKWDVLLSQNAHSSEIFSTAYEWDGILFEEGYPRNDPMSTKDGGPIRERLGIGPEKTVVLYAPTWRDNQSEMVTFLDLAELSRSLGDRFVFLLRGHSRTLAYGSRLDDTPGVIDVTTYPEVTELFLAADALITDYSSVMFDFSVTSKPMIFFVPDIADYRDSVRGVYFDLSEVAPGPVLFTQAEVTTAIEQLETAAPSYAERYRRWQQRFNAHDDGHSAERVVQRLFQLTPADLPRKRSPRRT